MSDRGDDESLPPPTDGQDWVDEIVARARSRASGATPAPRLADDPPVPDELDAAERPPTADDIVDVAPIVPPEVTAGPTPAPRLRRTDLPGIDDDAAPPEPPQQIDTGGLPPAAAFDGSTNDDEGEDVNEAFVGAERDLDEMLFGTKLVTAADLEPQVPDATSTTAASRAGSTGAETDPASTSRRRRRREATPTAVDTAVPGDDEPEEFFDPDLLLGTEPDAEVDASRPNRTLRTVVEWTAVIVGALVVALLIKTFLFQAFYIPSSSMEPTLHQGDRVLVNKLSYQLHDVNRGDVVVFEKPPGMSGTINDLIKRVIALPNETLELRDGQIYIDGSLLDEPYLADGVVTNPNQVMSGCIGEPSDTRCVVPDGMVLVMGDNRGDSTDGRFFGPIDTDTIVGRAFLKVYPLGDIGFL